jgi:alkylation response protein AidB-like acyl-CoA dehydrogenase
MDFSLTREQQVIQRAAREFADREIEPIVDEIEKEAKVPSDMAKKMAQAELLGMLAPAEYGGAEAGWLNYVLVVEQIHYPVTACTWVMTDANSFVYLVQDSGTEEQKQRYIKPVVNGETDATVAFTEPATGSDPKMLTSTAVLDGEHWVINGTKRFATGGNHSGPIILFAKTDGDKVSALLFDKFIEGYTVSQLWGLMGMRGLETVDVYLNDVRVPQNSIVGEREGGLPILLRMVSGAKLPIAIRSVACGQRALDEAIKYAKERTTRKGPIADMQGHRWLLAEMASRVEAGRWLIYRAAFLKDQGGDVGADSAMAKLFATQAGEWVVSQAFQIHGAYGYTTDFPIERIYRAVKQSEIAEGTNEIQRSIVGAALVR